MEIQQPDNETFDFGISELTFTLTSLSAPTFTSIELELWQDTDGDGEEDISTDWNANATFQLQRIDAEDPSQE